MHGLRRQSHALARIHRLHVGADTGLREANFVVAGDGDVAHPRQRLVAALLHDAQIPHLRRRRAPCGELHRYGVPRVATLELTFYVKVVRALVKAGVEVNHETNEREYCAVCGSCEIPRLLAAEPNAREEEGRTCTPAHRRR